MLNFKAHQFAWLCFHIEKLQSDCLWDDSAQTTSAEQDEWRKSAAGHLQFMKQQCAQLGMDSSSAQCDRIAARVKAGTDIVPVCYLLRDLESTIVGELEKPIFLALRDDLSVFYDHDDKPHFGEQVADQFRKSTHDIAEARRCFALERWDGCVHHLMLAIEQAIRKWAKDLKLKTRLPLDLENLEQILQAAEVKHKEVKQRKKSHKRDNDLKYIAETSGHFGFIKDAWRNHAAHGRERYDERKARNLMVHVEAFMRVLATRNAVLN